MSVSTNNTVTQIFTIASPVTGAAANADSLPTGVLWIDGIADNAIVTIASANEIGRYTFEVTMPILTAGQRVSVIVSATINSLNCVGKVWEDQAGDTYDATQTILTQMDILNTKIDDIKYITDQLDTTQVTQVTTNMAGHLVIIAGHTYNADISGLTIPANWEKIYWTVKRNPSDADTLSVIQLLISNPSDEDDGLLWLNSAAPPETLDEDGFLEVDQPNGEVSIYLSDDLTVLLRKAGGPAITIGSLGWDIKFIDSNGVGTGIRGTIAIVPTETKAIS